MTIGNAASAILSLGSFNTQIGSLAGAGPNGTVNLGTATLTDVQGGMTTFGGVISGTSGGLTLNGSGGTLILTNTNTYQGTTTLQAGTLRINSNAALGSTSVPIASA